VRAAVTWLAAFSAILVAFFFVALAISYPWGWLVIAAVVLVARVSYIAYQDWREAGEEERQQQLDITARADSQSMWWLLDDERGTYGKFPPAV
jgi:membrane protein YdbS with pleckstrin-like domain